MKIYGKEIETFSGFLALKGADVLARKKHIDNINIKCEFESNLESDLYVSFPYCTEAIIGTYECSENSDYCRIIKVQNGKEITLLDKDEYSEEYEQMIEELRTKGFEQIA